MTDNQNRLHAIDSARGIGIALVVFGHAWRGAQGAGLIGDEALFRIIDAAIYAFHMPLFFFLSGLLFLQALSKYSARSLLRGRVTRLLWPMALWTWIFFGLRLLAGNAANAPVLATDFPLIPLPPYEHLWFLWALFITQVAVIGVFSVLDGRVEQNALRWIAAGAAVSLALAIPFIAVPSLLWGPTVAHLPYFFAGIAMGNLTGRRLPPWRTAGSAAAFVGLLWATQGQAAASIHSLALVLLGWSLLMWLDPNRRAGGPVLEGLRLLGRASMVIYLSHTIFSAALRIAVLEAGVDDPALVLLGTTVAGLLGPLGLLALARRLKLERLLGI